MAVTALRSLHSPLLARSTHAAANVLLIRSSIPRPVASRNCLQRLPWMLGALASSVDEGLTEQQRLQQQQQNASSWQGGPGLQLAWIQGLGVAGSNHMQGRCCPGHASTLTHTCWSALPWACKQRLQMGCDHAPMLSPHVIRAIWGHRS